MATYLRRHSTLLINRILQNNNIKKSYDLNKLNRNFHKTLQLDKIVAFNLSDIGEGIREVTIKEWFVKVGDVVQQFDNLCEVQSDKATVTITSRYDGKISKIHHTIDEIALVGKPLLEFDVENEDGADEESSSGSSSEDESGQKSTQISSTPASCSGIGGGGLKGSPDTTQADILNEMNRKVLTTPSVRRIAMENNVDLKKVPPTGKLGRILKGDVLEYLNIVPAGTNKPHPTLLTKPVGGSSRSGSNNVMADTYQTLTPMAADRQEILKGVRKIMFKSMTESLKIPHFAYSDEIDMSALILVREELKATALERGIKLTYMPFFLKAASLALLKYPIINSSLDVSKETIIYKAAHNISVAMATADGLVVPNVKHCEQKSIFEIARDLNQLQERAHKGQLRPDDFSNGTFSLSNIGIIGGTYTHPCIMPPQVSIGAMGKTKIVPRFGRNNEIIRAHIMSVSWSADHRVIDGVTMASFSNLWKQYLENPNLFLLDGH